VGGVIHEYVSGFGVAAQMTGQTQGATLVNLPGGVQALYSGGTLQRFRFPDWQATIRAESSPTSRAFTESLAFAPFGERYALKGAPFNVDSFTGSPDQIVPDEYDFTAREESNPQGRWVSPDPMRGTGNKYVYANNNPLSYVDPYGLYTIDIDGIESSTNIEEVTEGENELTESHPWKDAQTPAQPKTDTNNSQDSGSNTPNNQQKDQANNESQKGQPAQTAQNQSSGQPAPTNPDGSSKSPNGDVPNPPNGKPPGWKPGDPLVPNEWVPKDPGKGDREKWGPKYPIPGGSQPGVSWDPDGHWDHDDGNRNRTRWLPGGGGQVDHDNNPTIMDRMKSITPGPILKLGTAGVVIYIIIDEGSRLYPPRNLVPVP
jgi:RHS repeat-associated protein